MSFDLTDSLKGFWECMWRTAALESLRHSGAGGHQLPCVLPASSCSVTGQLPRRGKRALCWTWDNLGCGASPIPKQLPLSWGQTAWWSCEMVKAYFPLRLDPGTASLAIVCMLFFLDTLDLKCDRIITEFVIPFRHWALPSLLLALSPTLLQEAHSLLPQI